LYRDIWLGGARFQGGEVIFHNNQPVWGMVYSGGIIPSELGHRLMVRPSEEQVYQFLRKALMVQANSARFGWDVVLYKKGEWSYLDSGENEASFFEGQESITFRGELIYSLHYSGGLIEG